MLVASLGGLTAAGTTLLVLCALGVIGWFVTDAGIHGAPRDGLRVAGLGWLAAHGAGVHIQGSAITLLPLGITADVCVGDVAGGLPRGRLRLGPWSRRRRHQQR